MTLSKRIIVSYAVIIVISAVITLIATIRLHNLNSFTLAITNQIVPALLEEKRAESLFYQLRNIVKKSRVFPGEEFREYFFKKIDDLRNHLDSIDKKLTGDEEKRILRSMAEELEGYQKLFTIKLDGFSQKDKDMLEKFEKSERRFSEFSVSLIKETEKILQDKLAQSSRMREDTSRFIWSMFLAAAVAMVVLAVFFTQYLTYSIRRLQKGTRKIAEGNFDYVLSVKENDEVGDLTSDFNIMAQKLKDTESMKAHFMSMVLHDLKGPITVMKGTLSLFLENKKDVPQKMMSSMEIINNEIEHLNRLVDDLNEVAHIDSGIFKMVRMPFNVQQLLGELVAGIQPLLQETNQKIELIVDSKIPKINGDRDRIKQVFTNLLTNASRFSPKDGIIRISAEAKADRVYCQVTDSGPGIPADKSKHIFEKFQKGDSIISKRIGSGLGLYIVKKIIDFHGGRIWFQSPEGQGTTFYFTLPYS